MRPVYTPTYRWLFYEEAGVDEQDEAGFQDRSTPLFITSGFFAFEKARKPVEYSDAGATLTEVQYILISRVWSSHIVNTIKTHHFAWCPALNNKLVELISEPLDPDGMQKQVMIYCVDNVQRVIDTGSLPTS